MGARLSGVHAAWANRSFRLGVTVTVAVAILTVLTLYKDRIVVAVKPTSTITVHFAERYGMTAYKSAVKMAGIKVGDVTEVIDSGDGSVVTLEVSDDVPGKLRSAPSARIRPTTLLGGNYFVDLVPGGSPGRFDGAIPADRTTVPVELDKISRTLQPDILKSLQRGVRDLSRTLDSDGREALQGVLRDAPETLRDAAPVLHALRGTRPGTDLRDLVRGLRNTAAALSEPSGRLDAIVRDLSTTSTVFGDRADDIARTVHAMPGTLDATEAGLDSLRVSLRKLRAAAAPAMPVAEELDSALDHLTPALGKARPVVNDLRSVVAAARPMVEDLNPVAVRGSAVLDDLRGPVLDRLNGPVKKAVLSPWRGTGLYRGGGADRPLYQELGYLASGMDRVTQGFDANGSTFGFGIGASPGSVGGLPISLEQLFGHLSGMGDKDDK